MILTSFSRDFILFCSSSAVMCRSIVIYSGLATLNYIALISYKSYVFNYNYTGSWSYSHTFEWAEGEGNTFGYITDLESGSPLSGSIATLYRSDGTSTGLSMTSGANGWFQFSNITSGQYYVKAAETGYLSNQSSMFLI